MATTVSIESDRNKTLLYNALVFLGTIAFSALFAWVNLVQYNWLSPQFERSSSPAVWGIIQRLWLILPAIPIVVRWPRQIGLQIGKTIQYWRMLVIMFVLNVAVMVGYRVQAGATPYTGIQMVFNEVVTVPLVEEIVWRGIVFAALFTILSRVLPEDKSGILAGVFSGICFGLLHSTNALFGYPLFFVALQTLNATVWGVVYGIARAKTGSIYPPVVLHAAMNLAVALG